MYLRQPGFFVDSVERFDKSPSPNRPQKAGFVWVEDKTVKGGGYWRKAPKGGATTTPQSRRERRVQMAGGGIGRTIATAVVAGTAGAIAAQQVSKAGGLSPLAESVTNKTLSLIGKAREVSPQESKQIKQTVQKAESAIDKKLKITGDKLPLSKRIAKEVAIEAVASIAGSGASMYAKENAKSQGKNSRAASSESRKAGRLIAKRVSEKYRKAYGNGIESKIPRKAIALTTRAGVAAFQAGMSVASNSKSSNTPLIAPKNKEKKGLSNTTKASIAVAGVTAAYLGYNQLDKEYQITDKAVLNAAEIAHKKLNEYENLDASIDKLPLGDKQKRELKNLAGTAKVYAATTMLKGEGGELVSVDTQNNFSTFKGPDGSLMSVGSVGSNLLTFASQNIQESAKGVPIYEMEFRVNDSYGQKGKKTKEEAVRLIKLAKAGHQNHIENLPDNTLLRARAYDADGKGNSRQSIYEKKGFKQLKKDGKFLWAIKKDGKFNGVTDANIEDMRSYFR